MRSCCAQRSLGDDITLTRFLRIASRPEHQRTTADVIPATGMPRLRQAAVRLLQSSYVWFRIK